MYNPRRKDYRRDPAYRPGFYARQGYDCRPDAALRQRLAALVLDVTLLVGVVLLVAVLWR